MSEPASRCKPAPPRRSPLDASTPSGAALRTALAGTLAMALAFALHVEVPALAVVYVLARGSAGTVTMIAGAVTGSALALVLLQLFDQSRVAFTASLFFLTAIGTYGALGRRFPYAFVQALLSLLVLVGQSLDTPDSAVHHAFYDLASVLIAALCAFVSGASQPAAIPGALRDALAARLRALATLLRADDRSSAAVVAQLELLARRSGILLAASWPTRLASRRRRRALEAATALVDGIAERALVVAALERTTPRDETERVRRAALADAIEEMAPLVADERGPRPDDVDRRRDNARARAAELRRSGVAPDARRGGLATLAARTEAAARRGLAQLALLTPDLGPGVRSEPPGGVPRTNVVRTRVVDRFRLRHAIKSAVSYLMVLWAWVISEWGAIVPALVVSVLVATLATPVGATLRKAVLRVGGVLAGGLAGLAVAVMLLPWITTLPTICLVSGAILLFFLWIQHHRETLSFAALQAAIAFTLTLVQGTGPSPTWREPLESLIGLAFGIVVVVGVMHAAWPIDASTSARATLGDLLEVCARRLPRVLAGVGALPSDAASDPLRVAARDAREHAAGFVHEVALYGTQFGRPREDLAGLLRCVVELDALLTTLEEEASRLRAADAARDASAPGAGGVRARDATVSASATASSALAARCLRLADELRAPLGDLPPRGDDVLPHALVLPRDGSAVEHARLLAERLLDEVHARIHAGAPPRRRAA